MPRNITKKPSDVAEEATIAGIMHLGSTTFVNPKLLHTDFHQSAMGAAYQAACNLSLLGLRPAPETVATESTRLVGSVTMDAPTLSSLLKSYPAPSEKELERLSSDVIRFSHCRRIKAECHAAIRDIDNNQCSPEDLADKLQATLVQVYNAKGEPTDAKASIDSVVRTAKERRRTGLPPGVSSGLRDLDEKLMFLCGGRVIVIAGRPGHGKTALMDNIVEYVVSKYPDTGAYVARLEFTEEQGAARVLSVKTGIPFKNIIYGRLSDEQEKRLEEENAKYPTGSVYVDTSASVESMRELCSKARRLKSKMATKGKVLKLVGIDSVQLFAKYDGSSREQAIAAISNMAKKLAMELDVTVLLLSALNREVERRESKKPILADLRESGALEQDADQVVMVYRESEYDANAPVDIGLLCVEKNRWGEQGEVTVKWDGARFQFSNYP